MTTPIEKSGFEREQELAAMVEAYRRLPDVEPSPELDRAVLETARRALGKPARQPRWPALLATAATVTLAFGLSWQLRDSRELKAPREVPAGAPPAATAPAPQASPPQPAVVSGDAADRDAGTADDGYRTPSAAAGEHARALEDERGAVETTTIAAPKRAPAPAAPAAPAELRKAEALEESKAEAFEESRPQSEMETAERHRAETAPRQDAPAVPAFVPDPEPPVAAESLEAQAAPAPPALEAKREQPASPGLAAPASPAPAPVAAPAPAPVDVTKQAADAERDAAPPAEVQRAPLGATSGTVTRRDVQQDVRDAEDWLRAIRALRAAGDLERARAELVAFERAWPDHPIPDDLRDLAR